MLAAGSLSLTLQSSTISLGVLLRNVRTSKDLIWSSNLWDFPNALVMSAAVSSTVILRIGSRYSFLDYGLCPRSYSNSLYANLISKGQLHVWLSDSEL